MPQHADKPATKRRDPVIDGLKLAAAGGIVMVHVAMSARPGALRDFLEQISYCALYFFFLVSGYFHGSLGTRGPSWLARRFVRLGVPYLIWSFIFIAWWELYHLIRQQPLFIPDPVRTLFFAGANEVLWSLPWLFACAVFAELFARTPTHRRMLLLASLAIQVAVWAFVPPSALPDFGLRQFIEGGRWVFIYVAGMELRATADTRLSANAWTVLGLTCMAAAGALAIVTHAQPTAFWPQVAMFTLCGTAAVAALAGAKAHAPWFGVGRLAWGGDYLLGIYCSHHLWLDIIARIFPQHQAVSPLIWIPFAWSVCFFVSIGVTRLLLAHRWARLAVV